MTGLARPVIAGNWKMNRAPAEAASLVRDLARALPPDDQRTVLLFPPAISFTAARETAADRPDLRFGVQNIHWEPDGAFTGEISARRAREAGAGFVLAGHSERRHVFGESDGVVAKKAAAGAAAGLVPVVCVGETLEERRADRVEQVILRQLDAALAALGERAAGILVAYEPVWAIGTGVVATPEDASAAHAVLRRRLRDALGPAAEGVPILYGGSVKPDNAAVLLRAPEVDGLLVGGASLEADSFARIATAWAPARR